MEYKFEVVEIPIGISRSELKQGYRLSNGVILMDCERNAKGHYLGGVGMDGIYLRTGIGYSPLLDESGQIKAFRQLT